MPFPSPGDLPHSGIELGSPALQEDLFIPTEPPGLVSVFYRQGNQGPPRAVSSGPALPGLPLPCAGGVPTEGCLSRAPRRADNHRGGLPGTVT